MRADIITRVVKKAVLPDIMALSDRDTDTWVAILLSAGISTVIFSGTALGGYD